MSSDTLPSNRLQGRRQVLLALAALVAGCANPIRPKEHLADRFEPWSDDFAEYRFLPGDELDVKLIYNPEFSDRVVVAPDGNIYLSLIGGVRALGRTAAEVVADTRAKYAVELRRPDVTVVPRSFASQVVYVGGEVSRPGVVKQEHMMGVLQGILAAGGMLGTANARQVVLIRRSSRDTPMLKVVNVENMLNGGAVEHDTPLRRFDVIFVPRTDAAEAGLWIDLHINRILPFSRDFSYTIQRNHEPPL